MFAAVSKLKVHSGMKMQGGGVWEGGLGRRARLVRISEKRLKFYWLVWRGSGHFGREF